MIWQDIVISFVSIMFSIALIPQIYHGFREKKGYVTIATSAPTAIGLYVISVAYLTLSLYFSASVTFITGTCWMVLFIQRLIYERL